MKKHMRLIALLFFALLLLAGCASTAGNESDSTTGENTDPVTKDRYFDDSALLIENGKACVTLVYTRDAMGMAKKLQTLFHDYGVDLGIVPISDADNTVPLLIADLDSALPAGSYSVVTDPRGIRIAAQNETVINQAFAAFERLMHEFTANGKTEIPCERLQIVNREVLPRLANAEVKTVSGPLSNRMELYENATVQDFEDYTALLVQNGYTCYDRREEAGNLFATYSCESHILCLWYTPYNTTLTVDFDPVSAFLPLDEDYAEQYTATRVAQTYYNYNLNFGMGYVIVLHDGSFFLIDGGTDNGSVEEGYEHIRFYQLLRALNPRPNGEIIIRGWLITHGHPDHTDLLRSFAEAYGDQVTLERLLYRPCAYTDSANDRLPASDLEKLLARFDSTPDLCILHPGQRASICGVEFTFLFTADLINGAEIHDFNNNSTVTRMTYQGQTVLWNGDTSRQAADILCALYGDALHCDIMQIAHHGYYKEDCNASAEYYTYADPSIVLWPHNDWCYNDWKTSDVNVHLLNELHVQEVWTAQDTAKIFTLPYYAGNGPECITVSSLPENRQTS